MHNQYMNNLLVVVMFLEKVEPGLDLLVLWDGQGLVADAALHRRASPGVETLELQ